MVDIKLQGKETSVYALLEKVVCFEEKLLLFSEVIESGKLIYFKNLKQYCDETNTTIDTNYFKITIKKIKMNSARDSNNSKQIKVLSR